jgi:hypothetical protein
MTHHEKFNYTDHYDIPPSIREYVETCADCTSFTDLTLDEINDYLNSLEDFYSDQEVA